MRQKFALSFLLALITLIPKAARADYVIDVAVVQCDPAQNRMLVRFGSLQDEAPAVGAAINPKDRLLFLSAIPNSLDVPWIDVPMQNAGGCRFKNGQDVNVTELTGYLSSVASGADPDAFFKLTIDGRFIYDKLRFYRGYGASTYDLSAIEYNGRALLECNPHEQLNLFTGAELSANPVCYDASKRLLPGHEYLTPDEKSELAQDVLRVTLGKSLSPFCKGLPPHPDFTLNYVLSDSIALGVEDDVDINNDGQPDRVFYFRNSTVAANGYGFLVAFTKNFSKVDNFLAKFGGDTWPTSDAVDLAAEQTGGHVIQLASENEVFRYRGNVYIYAFDPFPDTVPSATVSEMLPNDSIKEICAFP